MKKYIGLIIILILALLSTCTEDPPTAPKDEVEKLEPTGQDFTFKQWQFGDHSSSVLYAVHIFDENNIWAVGSILLNDTIDDGVDSSAAPYGLAVWNGKKWSLRRMHCLLPDGRRTIILRPTDILAFSEDEIFFAYGGVIIWQNNKWVVDFDWEKELKPEQYVRELWGASPKAIWGAGPYGTLVKREDTRWSLIETGTDMHFYDIYGDYNEETEEWEIFATCGYDASFAEHKIVKIDAVTDEITEVAKPVGEDLGGRINSIWFKAGKIYYVSSGNHISYKYNIMNDEEEWKILPKSMNSGGLMLEMTGPDTNDIFGAGGFGVVVHYNGEQWKSFYEDPGVNLTYGNYHDVDMKDDIVVVVGLDGIKATVSIGRRGKHTAEP